MTKSTMAPRTSARTAALVTRSREMLRLKEGTKRERLELAVGRGLLVADGWRGSGEVLRKALHCATLAQLQLDGAEKLASCARRAVGPSDFRDPAHLLSCLVQAHEQLEQVLAAVSAELDRAGAARAA